MAAGVKISKIGTFDFNPRGNLWFNDESTFGHKLLSKMGWSKGKGLGKNEDGIKENIKISKKDSLTGVGYKCGIPIAESCSEYDKVLNDLLQNFKSKQTKNSKNVDSANHESLEQRSRNTRNRLHYQKYVRGKDLYRYSEKDMKCIFMEKPQESVNEKINEQEKLPSFNSNLSVQDYFAMKMQKKTCKDTEKDLCAETKSIPHKEIPLSCSVVDKKRKNSFKNSDKIKRTKIKHEEHLNELQAESDLSTLDESLKAEKSKERSCDCVKLIKRRKKLKKNKLKCVKSCLSNSSSYSFVKNKKVTFNDQVSYKLLDTSLELCSPIKDSVDKKDLMLNLTRVNDLSSTETAVRTENGVSEHPINGVVSELKEDSSLPMEKDENNSVMNDAIKPKTDESEELENPLPKCFDLPKNVSSNYNFWLENQRQALKMKLYKTMIKNIKKHKILGTSNLLDIKGYGNWGL